MNIIQKIEQDSIKALKNKEKSLETLRMLKNSIKNAEIEKGEKLSNEEVMIVLRKEKKQREEAVNEFKKGKRNDLAEKEKAEIKIIEELGNLK